MAKKKSRHVNARRSRSTHFARRCDLRQNRLLLSEGLRSSQFSRRRRTLERLTRDTLHIANPVEGLSLAAEDLRSRQPFQTSQHRVFHNVDGSPANTSYKEVPLKKKDLMILVGEVFTVLIILFGLWCVAEDMRDGVCSLPTELLDAVKGAVRNLLGVPNGPNNLS